jgi:hypothetical protein
VAVYASGDSGSAGQLVPLRVYPARFIQQACGSGYVRKRGKGFRNPEALPIDATGRRAALAVDG